MKAKLSLLILLCVQLACSLEQPRVVTVKRPRLTDSFLLHNVDREPARVEIQIEGGYRKPYEVER